MNLFETCTVIVVYLALIATAISIIGAPVMGVKALSNATLSDRRRMLWIVGLLFIWPMSIFYMVFVEKWRGWRLIGAFAMFSMGAALAWIMGWQLYLALSDIFVRASLHNS
jgi:hypothetical protein